MRPCIRRYDIIPIEGSEIKPKAYRGEVSRIIRHTPFAVFVLAAPFLSGLAVAADGIMELKAIFEPVMDKGRGNRVVIAIKEFERSPLQTCGGERRKMASCGRP